MLQRTHVARPDLLIIGAVTIVAANLAITVEDRMGTAGAMPLAAATAEAPYRTLT